MLWGVNSLQVIQASLVICFFRNSLSFSLSLKLVCGINPLAPQRSYLLWSWRVSCCTSMHRGLLSPQPGRKPVSPPFTPQRPKLQYSLFPWMSASGQFKRAFVLRIRIVFEEGIEEPHLKQSQDPGEFWVISVAGTEGHLGHCHQNVPFICHLPLSKEQSFMWKDEIRRLVWFVLALFAHLKTGTE